jgi:hypothetical protein
MSTWWSKLFGKKDNNNSLKISQPENFQRILTSQLVAYLIATGEHKYKKEFLRRMKLCGVSDKIAGKTFIFEEEILRRCPRPEMTDSEFIAKAKFNLSKCVLEHPMDYYETHFDYPLSYVVKLSDEAEWHFWNSHERNLSDEVWEEIFALSDKNRKLFLPYAMNMVDGLGWTVPEVNKFSYHEQGMLDLYRWNKKMSGAARNPWNMK